MSTSPYASHPAPAGRSKAIDRSDSVALWAVVSLLLGILVAVLGFFAMMMWVDAHNAKDAANRAAAKVSGGAATTDMPGMPGMAAGNTASAVSNLQSYAGAAPTNAAELAAAHKPYPATLPAAAAGAVANVHLRLTDITVQIAPGVKYSAWAWAGGAPGPVIHVRQGQQVKITLTNNGAIPHSVDFHAARVARTRPLPTSRRGRRSATRSGRTIRASSCTTAAPNRC